MPERPLRIATYAAGASLAAITLVYVFGPTFFLDDEAANRTRSDRKKGVVGLVNPANDCFINSILQVLAGLPELRKYLIREMHRRDLDGPELYQDLTAALEEQTRKKNSKPVPEWKLLGLQQGLVTAGLKDVLDALNERPIYKKTISAQSFIRVVEQAFRTRISRSQQDAQEFLQVIAERLADEHYAGGRARRWAAEHGGIEDEQDRVESSVGPADSKTRSTEASTSDLSVVKGEQTTSVEVTPPSNADVDEKTSTEKQKLGFPLQGQTETIVECLHCSFKPEPRQSSFVTLTLNVPPNVSSTTLNACIDGQFKQEHIDEYVCDRCRLEHALEVTSKQLSKPNITPEQHATLTDAQTKIESALSTNPEKPPSDVELPPKSTAPKRRISKHMRISQFPRVLVLHLNRSVWTEHSSKNTAKVSFPESLPLGGLLDRKTYRLLGAVTHKGGHNSGHYESFRRQYLPQPFSTPASMGTEGMFSPRPSPAPSPRVSAAPSPRLAGRNSKEASTTPDSPNSSPSSPDPHLLSTPSLDSPTSSSASSRSLTSLSSPEKTKKPPTSVPMDAIPTPGLPTPPSEARPNSSSGMNMSSGTGGTNEQVRPRSSLSAAVNRAKRRPGGNMDRWWRISDDKIKEGKTSDVLGMQREVYLLFYEMVED